MGYVRVLDAKSRIHHAISLQNLCQAWQLQSSEPLLPILTSPICVGAAAEVTSGSCAGFYNTSQQ